MEDLAVWEIRDPHAIKGGGCYKQAAAELIVQKARETVSLHYKDHKGWQCLHQPVGDWENSHFIHLATLLDVGTCTVKRIFEHRCHDGETENISPKVKRKLEAFLKTDDLDAAVCGHIARNGGTAK